MAEAVILSAIESLDGCLLKMAVPNENNYKKLLSLVVGMTDHFGEDNMEKLYLTLFGMADIGIRKENLYDRLVRLEDFGKDNKEKLWSFLVEMADFGEENKEKLYSFLVGMEELEEDKKVMLYSLLVGKAEFRKRINKENLRSLVVGMADFWEDNEVNLYSLLVGVADVEGDKTEKMLYSLLVEMTDLWEDEEHDDKEKLRSLLVELAENDCNYEEKLYGILVSWEYKNLKLNHEKLCGWLANKVDLWENEKLFNLLLDVVHRRERKRRKNLLENGEITTNLEIVKTDLMDLVRHMKVEEESSRLHLQYFVSDVVEMAHDANLLIRATDSVPFLLLSQILNRVDDGDAEEFLRKISSIQEGLRESKERMLAFEGMTSQNVGELEGSKDDVVGLEEDVKLLLHNENTVTCIRGIAGIGKTTLARELYNHPTIVDQFECRAWACLSREFSRKEVLMQLIRQILVDDAKELEVDVLLEKMDNKSLKHMLHQQLQGKRYFIVLDHVDEHTYIQYVLEALPQLQDRGSRLLFTTRKPNMKFNSLKVYYHHKMKFLDNDKSWQLLLKTVFFGTSTTTSDQKFPKHLEKKGRKALTICNGIPLAIKEVGRQWARKRQSGGEWEQLLESTDLSETLVALESSYNNLNSEKKSFFMHLAFFKECTIIRAEKLGKIWSIGRAFSEELMTSEQIPVDYLDCISELSEESIIEVKDKTKYGRTKTLRINTVFHKLSIKKAVEETRFEILRKDGYNRPSHEPRHRAIYCSREKFEYYFMNEDKHLVSLFFYGGSYFNTSPSYWKHFEQLKILDMEGFGLKILPDEVGTLVELRYLGLRNNYIQGLPHSLGHLKKLEVLDIALNFMVEVGDIIWEMDSLRHLYMSDISFQKPLKIDALKNLETLTYISVDSWTYEVSNLKMMTSLHKLGIEKVDGNSDVGKLFASLAELKNLDCLILRGFRFRSMPILDELGIMRNLIELKLDGQLTRLPGAENFPWNIKYLSLVNSSLDEDPMPILEMIFGLRYLKLQNAYTGQQMVISPNGFSYLLHLVIGELWHLRNVQVGEGAMWVLNKLEITSCPYLFTLPEEILKRFGR